MVSDFKNAKLIFIDMQNKFQDLFTETNFKGHFTKEIYYKFIVPSLLPEFEKVIVTDVDVVFTGDISKDYMEFNVDEDYYFAGVRCISTPPPKKEEQNFKI